MATCTLRPFLSRAMLHQTPSTFASPECSSLALAASWNAVFNGRASYRTVTAGSSLVNVTARHFAISNSSSSAGSAKHNTAKTGVRGSGFSNTSVFLLTLASSLFGYGIAKFSSHDSYSTLEIDDQKTRLATPEEIQIAIIQLKEAFKGTDDKVSTNLDDLYDHGFSPNDHHPGVAHSVIVYPTTTEDVVKVVEIAKQYRVPVVPYSGATSLEGQYRGSASGGICVDMSNMDKIIAIHEQDADVICQPGARWMDINEMLKEKGIPLFFPIDPAPGATIGGMLSTGCSGTNAVRYGTAKGEWFLNATVVLPSGEVIKTRQRSRKSSAGFDVTKLFIGAEGTLGIVTEVTIRLAPVLPTTVAIVHFPNVQKATEAVMEVLNAGVGVQCVELVDDVFMSAINKFGMSAPFSSPPSTTSSILSYLNPISYFSTSKQSPSQIKYPELDSLFFKFQGPTAASLAETSAIVEAIVKKYGGTGYRVSGTEKEAHELWSDRKNAHYAGLALGSDGVELKEGEVVKGWPTDVCVPVSALPKLIAETKADLQQAGLLSTMVGHVGDGNFHALILFKNEEERKKAKKLVKNMVVRAIAMDGTCTGEHGVGIGKKEYLVDELGEGTVRLMKTIKKTLDPLGLFNPGKLYPDDVPPGTMD